MDVLFQLSEQRTGKYEIYDITWECRAYSNYSELDYLHHLKSRPTSRGRQVTDIVVVEGGGTLSSRAVTSSW
ncbi:hypothetical protein J6590_029071 [Homalodisca vitripennis]|nr:hypothetical protein J6590_029071 [Homalodisca vitripennis]